MKMIFLKIKRSFYWERILIVIGILLIALILFIRSYQMLNDYLINMEKIKYENMLKEESLKRKQIEEEEKYRIQKEIEESKRIEEEKRKKIIIESIRTNTLYENTISKKRYPIGTYVKNLENNKYGQVVMHNGLRCITNCDWYFEIDDLNDCYSSQVEIVGFKPYWDWLSKQKENEKISESLRRVYSSAYSEEYAKGLETSKKMFPKHNNYFIYNGIYEAVDKYDGYILVTRLGHRIHCLDKGIKKVTFMEYDQSFIGDGK